MARTDEELSRRELQVLALLVEGLNNVDIATSLDLSPRTVQSHVSNALQKTRTHSRTELAVAALRRGLLPLHGERV